MSLYLLLEAYSSYQVLHPSLMEMDSDHLYAKWLDRRQMLVSPVVNWYWPNLIQGLRLCLQGSTGNGHLNPIPGTPHRPSGHSMHLFFCFQQTIPLLSGNYSAPFSCKQAIYCPETRSGPYYLDQDLFPRYLLY